MKQYHILNGDALKEQFPSEIEGEVIIARECLVDGDVKSKNLEELWELRAGFITEFYGDYSKEDYFKDTVSEFNKIINIPPGSIVNLWFEDDLFCQVNFWFVSYLLSVYTKDCDVYLVRPNVHTQYGFGGLSQEELANIFHNKTQLFEIDEIADLWKYYKENEIEDLVETARILADKYPFVQEAVQAHIERIPTQNSPGRPVESLKIIMEELDTDGFGPIFQEFNKWEFIYGYGELQVRRIYNSIKDQRSDLFN